MPLDNRPLDRRKFLKASGGVTVAGLIAGCTGEDEPDDNGTADDDDDDTEPTDEYANFPEREVRLVVPYGPGGGYDQYSRQAAPYLEQYLPGDGDVIVDNVEGAGARIAHTEVYGADPDGYTIMIIDEDQIPVQLIEDVPYDVSEMPVFGNFAVDINSLYVSEDLGVADLDEFTDLMQSDEPPLCAVQSIGGAIFPILLGELSGRWSADDVVDNIVLSDSRGESIQQIQGGDAHYTAGSVPSVQPHAGDDGILEPLLIGTTDEQAPEALGVADAPTLGSENVENGQDIMDMTIDGRTYGGPPGMDEELVELYRDAFRDTANDDDFAADLEEIDRPLQWVEPEDQQASMQNRVELWQDHMDILEILYGEG